MAKIGETSDHLAIDMNANRFNHVYMRYRGKLGEVSDFQNGQALTGQRTSALASMQEDYENKPHFYQPGSKTGQATLNVLDDSQWDSAFGYIATEQANATADDIGNTLVDIIYTNDLTNKTMVAEKCFIQNTPNANMNNSNQSAGWVFLASKYDVNYKKPDLDFLN